MGGGRKKTSILSFILGTGFSVSLKLTVDQAGRPVSSGMCRLHQAMLRTQACTAIPAFKRVLGMQSQVPVRHTAISSASRYTIIL